MYFGDYPKSMRDTQGDMLPKFTPAESKLLKGSMDFFGVSWGVGGAEWSRQGAVSLFAKPPLWRVGATVDRMRCA